MAREIDLKGSFRFGREFEEAVRAIHAAGHEHVPALDGDKPAETAAKDEHRPEAQHAPGSEEDDADPAEDVSIKRPEIRPIGVGRNIGGDEPDQADCADNLAVTAVLALARTQVALAEQRRRGEDEENGGKSEPGRMSKKTGEATPAEDSEPEIDKPSRQGGQDDHRAAGASTIGNFIVASIEKLDETQTVAERISKYCDLAPPFGADRVLDQGARRHGPRERALDPVDDDVKVHRRPVPVVSAKARSGTDRASLLTQKEEGNLPAYQLHSARPEPPSDRKPESIGVERNRTLEIRHVNIDQYAHVTPTFMWHVLPRR